MTMVYVYACVAIVWCVMWSFEWGDRVDMCRSKEERAEAARMVLASPVWIVVVAALLVRVVRFLMKELLSLLRDAGVQR